MWKCILCHFDHPLDDVVLRHQSGQIVCLRCYCRIVDGSKPFPRELYDQVDAVLWSV